MSQKRSQNGVHFLYAYEHQIFCKLPLLFLKEVTTHAQITQNRKLVIFMQYLKKKVLQLLLYSAAMQIIQIF